MKVEEKSAFATIEEAIEDIRQGKFVVVVDAADRENEGDLTIAAQFATPDAVNFMTKEARGLICLAQSLHLFCPPRFSIERRQVSAYSSKKRRAPSRGSHRTWCMSYLNQGWPASAGASFWCSSVPGSGVRIV